ncbi:MAG: tetratricopeptide repeat protein [Bacteroidetes bacterium]|nr:MAG: tetratricopeptide repeat protein [Bacteroidota bacterium]
MKSKIDNKKKQQIRTNSKSSKVKNSKRNFRPILLKYVLPLFGLLVIIGGIWFLFIKKSSRDLYAENFKKAGLNSRITILYPRNNSIFPPEIASPTIQWNDPDKSTFQWLVMVEKDNKVKFISDYLDENKWKPDSSDWEELKSISKGGDLTINVIGIMKEVPGKIYNGGKVNISISKDSVGAPIFFRAVTLPFGFAATNLPTISWRLGNIANYSQPKILLTNLTVCGNCHSFSKDGNTIGMDVDYGNDKGSYFISTISKNTDMVFDNIITWSDYKREDKEYTFGLLSQISPDGRYALSTVKDRSIFVKIDNMDYSQLFFPIKGIIAVYDTKTKKFWALPGADDKLYCQSNPVWSPDGKTILFAKAPVYHHQLAELSKEVIIPTEYANEFIEGKRDFKFDIYQIPFNDGNGGEAKPLQGASNNGMSNYFPKFSPDGKWIVFTQAKNFMLLQPDAKLFIMPASGGTPRLMNCNNLNTMNSWHSWSPNGKWLVFSSKAKGPYTQLYLTHIDENGNDSPSILLENMTIRSRAANIPEFINIKYNNLESLNDKFIGHDVYTIERSNERLRLKDYTGALRELDKAISINPNDMSSINMRGLVKFELGRHKDALEDFNKVVELDPNSFSAYHNRANAKMLLKDYEGAIEDFDIAIKMDPQNPVEYYDRGEVKFDIGDFKGAIKDFTMSVRLDPRNEKAYSTMASAKYNISDFRGAVKDFDKTLELNPRDSVSILKRGLSKMQLGMIESGCLDLKESYKLGYKEALEYINKYCK